MIQGIINVHFRWWTISDGRCQFHMVQILIPCHIYLSLIFFKNSYTKLGMSMLYSMKKNILILNPWEYINDRLLVCFPHYIPSLLYQIKWSDIHLQKIIRQYKVSMGKRYSIIRYLYKDLWLLSEEWIRWWRVRAERKLRGYYKWKYAFTMNGKK